MRLFVRGPAGPSAEDAWAAVRAEFDAVDRALSRFRDDSELTALNRLAGTGRVVEVSWRLRMTLAAIHRAGRVTGGRFDASVLADLERMGERGAALDAGPGLDGGPVLDGDPAGPTVRTLDPLAPLDRPSRVRVPAAPVDTGGIGKGLALRWARR